MIQNFLELANFYCFFLRLLFVLLPVHDFGWRGVGVLGQLQSFHDEEELYRHSTLNLQSCLRGKIICKALANTTFLTMNNLQGKLERRSARGAKSNRHRGGHHSLQREGQKGKAIDRTRGQAVGGAFVIRCKQRAPKTAQ